MYICTKQTLQTLVLLFFMLFSITAHADKHIQRFSSLQFGTEEGLNSLRVFSIATDKSGAIWMGTLDGINRFNGYTFKTYKARQGNYISLTNNRVDRIYEDRLWFFVATDL